MKRSVLLALVFVASLAACTTDFGERSLPPQPTPSGGAASIPAPPEIGVPDDLLDIATPALPAQDRAGLDAYLAARRSALRLLPRDRSVMVGVTLRTSVPPSDAILLFANSGMTVIYMEYEIPGTGDHGGFPAWHLDLRMAAEPNLQIVYAMGWGRVDALVALSGAAQIWLVDPGATRNFYWTARAVGALAD